MGNRSLSRPISYYLSSPSLLLRVAGPELQAVRADLVVGQRPVGDATAPHAGQQGVTDENHTGLAALRQGARAATLAARIGRARRQSALREPSKVTVLILLSTICI